MKGGQSVFQADADLYAEASNKAFNICCAWLIANDHGRAAFDLAAYLNSGHMEFNQENSYVPAVVENVQGNITAKNAAEFGYTGSVCTGCGSMAMVRNGTCEKCLNCGTTTGCS